MAWLSLDLDRAFVDFHVSELWDPAFRPGLAPSQAHLFEMVYAARKGERGASYEFADTMYWTLREAGFDCFQRKYGPRPIRYDEWYYAKLKQYLEILVYEQLSLDGIDPSGKRKAPETDQPWNEGLYVIGSAGPCVQHADIEGAFVAADHEAYPWGELVHQICLSTERRLSMLEGILRRQRDERVRSKVGGGESESDRTGFRGRGWGKNRERDRAIRNLLQRGESGREICEQLDRLTIPTLPILQKHQIHQWVKGWDDPGFQNNIQQLFSKVGKRGILVKG